MQTIIKNKKLYNVNLKKFADWTSNIATGEVKTRTLENIRLSVNQYTVFNRNRATRSLAKQANYNKQDQERDFPNNSAQIAFLTGGKKQ